MCIDNKMINICADVYKVQISVRKLLFFKQYLDGYLSALWFFVGGTRYKRSLLVAKLYNFVYLGRLLCFKNH